jgi:hypothetical protein
MEEGKLAFAKVSSNYSVGYKDGRASAIKEFKKFLNREDGDVDSSFWVISRTAFAEQFEKELGGTK